MRYLVLALIIIGLQACNEGKEKRLSTDIVHNTQSASNKVEKKNIPVITLEEGVHDFGEVIQGERVSYSFKFTNTGGSDLVITRVASTCGCTVGYYPTEPIKPGQTGEIEASFDSHKRKGYQNKKLTILANTEPSATEIRIKAKVIIP